MGIADGGSIVSIAWGRKEEVRSGDLNPLDPEKIATHRKGSQHQVMDGETTKFQHL
jgi:hypothetical protein